MTKFSSLKKSLLNIEKCINGVRRKKSSSSLYSFSSYSISSAFIRKRENRFPLKKHNLVLKHFVWVKFVRTITNSWECLLLGYCQSVDYFIMRFKVILTFCRKRRLKEIIGWCIIQKRKGGRADAYHL